MAKATSDNINKRVSLSVNSLALFFLPDFSGFSTTTISLITIISSTRHSRFTVDMFCFFCFSNFVRASTHVNCWRTSLRLWKNLCLGYRFSTRFSVSRLADVNIHDMNRMAIYRESRNNSSVSARKIAACKRTFTGITLWDQQYSVRIGEAGFSQINAIFHSESELIPTIQRSKWYFKYLD